jgi:hypothetical protein
MPTRGKINKNSGNFVMSIGHEVGVIKLPDMAVGHGNPSVLTNQIQRYITELSAAGSMYDQFSSAVVLDGDFELEIVCTLSPDGQYILSKLDSELGYDRFGITGSGSFFGLVNSASPYGPAITFDSKLHTIVMNRVGNYCELFIDGVSHIDGLYSTSAIELDNVGAPYAGTTTVPYMDGIWLSLKIWSGGDRTTGTLVMDATKDGDGSVDLIVNAAGTPYLTRVNQTPDEVTLYTEDAGNYIGPEMWTYGDYTYTGDEGQYALLLGKYGATGGIEAGKSYRWAFTPDLISAYDTSQIRLRMGGETVATITKWGTDGTTYSGVAVMAVDESRQDLLLQTGADPQFESGTITGISVKRLIEVA